jgi:Tat protein secretion system quality control protein TatD with DNase activity
MQLVDSHAHLNMENYKKDLDEVIARAKEKGIVKVLVVGIDRKTGEKALALKEKFKDYIEVSLGFHPHEVKERLMAVLLDEGLNELKRAPVSELAQELENYKDSVKYVVFDGIITQRLVDILSGRPDEIYLIGVRVGDISKPADNVKVITFNQA